MSVDNLVRGQFRGYRDEPGVAKDSSVATYAALRLYVDSWRWEGVPFYVRAGKSLKMTCTEVFVELIHPPPVVFTEETPSQGNYVRFRLSPNVVIAIGARAKRSGEGMMGKPVELLVTDQAEQGEAGRMEAYERLLGDAMLGDATLFARQDVVEAAWAVVDPVIHGSSSMFEYEPGSWGPPQADRLVDPEFSDGLRATGLVGEPSVVTVRRDPAAPVAPANDFSSVTNIALLTGRIELSKMPENSGRVVHKTFFTPVVFPDWSQFYAGILLR
jgi:glucose-6-phosphate 1-dehydrogenase